MSQKRDKIAAAVAEFQGRELDAHYLGYFECFNRQLFYEAHEVLEVRWLAERRGPKGPFYKGLIQLAGAFVHVQKDRPGPANALFKLAAANLEKYAPTHERLDLRNVLDMIARYRRTLESEGRIDLQSSAPRLGLESIGALLR